ncbi:unnamed protein product [Hymenolepis diminuta]|uniref:Uncharacterized protein n=1 Tax=Hymenolepis diminuta TaxID=6216 RepID=A0A564YDK4_HYMDI|nr:unnamed protein product [Hymenolepis diminuta]
MIVEEASLTRLCLGASPVHTVPSFSYNHPVLLNHTHKYVLTYILIQVTNINGLPLHAHDIQTLSRVRDIFLRFLLPSILSSPWESVLRCVQYILI